MKKQKTANKTPKQVQNEINQKRISDLSKKIDETVAKIMKATR